MIAICATFSKHSEHIKAFGSWRSGWIILAREASQKAPLHVLSVCTLYNEARSSNKALNLLLPL